jgi:adenylate cyclase
VSEGLTLRELQRQSGVGADDLLHWASLGLLRLVCDGEFAADSLPRAALVQFAVQRGVTAEMIAASSAHQGDVLDRYVDQLGIAAEGRGRLLEDVARDLEVEPEFFERVRRAAGLADQLDVGADDVQAMRTLALVRSLGFPEEALLQLIRVFADSTTRIADAAVRTFHFYVHEQLRKQGLVGHALVAATNQRGEPMQPLVEPILLYFHRKAWQRAMREDMLLHLAEEVTPPGQQVGELSAAVLFVDLASFTPLTEAMGDETAASVLDRFSELVRDAASSHTGRIVKQIGDEFMLVFSSAPAAVRCGVEICERTNAESYFPAVRLGAHVGTVLYREGDYTGTNVNIAARVADEARGGQFLVTDPVRAAADADISFAAVGSRTLKGLRGDIALYEVDVGARAAFRVTDPVCGVQLDPESSVSRLSTKARDLHFCSTNCLKQYLDEPERYPVP